MAAAAGVLVHNSHRLGQLVTADLAAAAQADGALLARFRLELMVQLTVVVAVVVVV